MAMSTFLKFYQNAFNRRPALTLVCANATLNAIGDVVAQTSQITLAKRDPDNMQVPKPPYDLARTLRFAAFGALMGPIIGRWAKYLEFKFPLRHGKRANFLAVTKRVASDQILMAPFGLAVFLSSMGLMEGRSTHDIRQKFNDLFVPALLANWMVWPFAQMINYRFMPLPYRVPFQSTCGVFWTLYLSLLNSSENKTLNIHEKVEKQDSTFIYQRIQRDVGEELRAWEEAKDHARHH